MVKVALLFRAWATSTPLSLSDTLTVIRGLVDFVVVVIDFVVVVVVNFVVADFVGGGGDVVDAGTLIVVDVDISIVVINGSLLIVVDDVDILNGVAVSFVDDAFFFIVVVTLVFDFVVAAFVIVAVRVVVVVCSVSSFLTN